MPTYCGSQDWHHRTEWDVFGQAQKVREKVARRCDCWKCTNNLIRWAKKNYTPEERIAQLEASRDALFWIVILQTGIVVVFGVVLLISVYAA